MKKIELQITMNEQGDITIKNDTDGKELTIFVNDKRLNAKDLYEVLNFEVGNTYNLKDNLESIENEKDKKILKPIVDIVKKIADELSKIKPGIEFDQDGEQ